MQLHVLACAQELIDIAAHHPVRKVASLQGLDKKGRDEHIAVQRLDEEAQRFAFAVDNACHQRVDQGRVRLIPAKRPSDRCFGVDRQDNLCLRGFLVTVCQVTPSEGVEAEVGDE